jgi:ribonuclease-3
MRQPLGDEFQTIEARLGYCFLDRSLLEAALTHPSALPVGAMRAGEQLEFLGDAVLDLVIADLLHLHLPDLDEGELSKRRATLVRTVTLAEKARGLGSTRRLARPRRGSQRGREKASILAYVYEAVLGAVYRRRFRARAQPDRRTSRKTSTAAASPARLTWKTILQERTQAAQRSCPSTASAKRAAGARAPLRGRGVGRRAPRRRLRLEQAHCGAGRGARRARGRRRLNRSATDLR